MDQISAKFVLLPQRLSSSASALAQTFARPNFLTSRVGVRRSENAARVLRAFDVLQLAAPRVMAWSIGVHPLGSMPPLAAALLRPQNAGVSWCRKPI
eukprot:s240_g35.t1